MVEFKYCYQSSYLYLKILRKFRFQRKSSALWIEIRHAKQITGNTVRTVRRANYENIELCGSKYYMHSARFLLVGQLKLICNADVCAGCMRLMCPMGDPGLIGPPGADGVPGSSGKMGMPGTDGEDGMALPVLFDLPCSICPAGPPGLRGSQGERGRAGLSGPLGPSG